MASGRAARSPAAPSQAARTRWAASRRLGRAEGAVEGYQAGSAPVGSARTSAAAGATSGVLPGSWAAAAGTASRPPALGRTVRPSGPGTAGASRCTATRRTWRPTKVPAWCVCRGHDGQRARCSRVGSGAATGAGQRLWRQRLHRRAGGAADHQPRRPAAHDVDRHLGPRPGRARAARSEQRGGPAGSLPHREGVRHLEAQLWPTADVLARPCQGRSAGAACCYSLQSSAHRYPVARCGSLTWDESVRFAP